MFKAKLKNALEKFSKIFWGKKNNLSLKTKVVLCTLAVLIGYGIPRTLVWASDESIDKSLLLKLPGKPEVHEYVTFVVHKNEYIKKDQQVSKKVACMEGDLLEIRNGNQYFCNYALIGTAKSHTKTGKPLKSFQYNGKIPAGKMFVVGTHPDSYDSRYFGFVDIEETQRLVGLFDIKWMASL